MIREETIVDILESYIAKETGAVFREVPFLHRRIDLVGYDASTGRVLMVEAKVKNWRQALAQARTCLLCTDEVYIALPNEFAHRVQREALYDEGIGLFAVTERRQLVEVLERPTPSLIKHEYHVQWINNLMERLNNQRSMSEAWQGN